jgi:lipopolysaccharide assembly outer membrane protein LptD (OstA)
LADEYAKQGKDWEVELRQRSREKQLMDELGILPEKQTTSITETDEDEE